MMFRIFAGVCCFLIAAHAKAEGFYQQRERGWHWFEKKEEQQLKKPIVPQKSATEQMHEKQRELEEALHLAVLHPTEEHVVHLKTLLARHTQTAHHFSTLWKEVLLTHPELDYSLVHPENELGLRVEKQIQQKKIEQSILNISNQFGLFFFYKASCPYAQQFAPILKKFAEKYQLKVMAVTLDGGQLPDFPAKQDNGMTTKLEVYATPALFAVDTSSKRIEALNYGLVGMSELEQQFLLISEKLNRKEQEIVFNQPSKGE